MSRGRHAKRTGLLARLFPGRRRAGRVVAARQSVVPDLTDRFAALEGEVARLRVLGIAHAAAAASADVRARRAEEQLGAARDELRGLRGDLAALREELVWAFADGRLPVAAPVVTSVVTSGTVVDLRDGTARTA